MGSSVSSQSVSSSNSAQEKLENITQSQIIKEIKESTEDIRTSKIAQLYFAKCPIRGWFVDHWALIIEQENACFLTVQFVKGGLEIESAFDLLAAKDCVSRCSLTQVQYVQTNKLGKTEMTVGQVVDAALSLSRDYNFVTYNCRHFVYDLLNIIKQTSFETAEDQEEVVELRPEQKSIMKK